MKKKKYIQQMHLWLDGYILTTEKLKAELSKLTMVLDRLDRHCDSREK